MASHKHYSALLDVLNEKEVPIEATLQEVLSHMGVETSSHPLLTSFNEELPPKGATHARPLQITIECVGAKVLMLLTDNGSTFNVCPFRTTPTIGLDVETIIPSLLAVRAYYNTLRKVMGTFEAPHKIGLLETIIEFHVMDITPNYNLFLRRA